MRKYALLFLLLVFLQPTTRAAAGAGSVDANAPAPPGVPAVQVDAIEESRARNVVHDVHAAIPLGDEVTLDIGYTPALDGPSGYGTWHVRQASDDLGTDLHPPPPSREPLPATTQEFDWLLETATDSVEPNAGYTPLVPELLKADRDRGANQFQVYLRLGLPPRAATRIAHLAGDLTVFAGGQVQTVTFDRPTRFLGRSLESPVLHAAGVAIDMLPANAPDDPRQLSVASPGPHVRLRCRGDARAFADNGLEVRDAGGKSASSPGSVSDAVDPEQTDQTLTLALSRPLDDAMKIRVTVAVGRRSVVVPFDLRDVPLP